MKRFSKCPDHRSVPPRSTPETTVSLAKLHTCEKTCNPRKQFSSPGCVQTARIRATPRNHKKARAPPRVNPFHKYAFTTAGLICRVISHPPHANRQGDRDRAPDAGISVQESLRERQKIRRESCDTEEIARRGRGFLLSSTVLQRIYALRREVPANAPGV